MSTREAFLDPSASVGNETIDSASSPSKRDMTSSRLRASKALFLIAAGVSFLLSVFLWFLVDREQGLFVGIWVPSILSLGALLLANPGGER